MKLPTIVKLGKYHRFNITPRYYDPIKEEIENRTQAIKRELEEEGVLRRGDDSNASFSPGYRSSIRGSFRSRSKAKSSSVFERSGLMRLLIFVILLGGLAGYLYLGNEVLYYVLYLTMAIGMWMILNRLKRRNKNE